MKNWLVSQSSLALSTDKSESIKSFKILIMYDNKLACKLIAELHVIVAGVACMTYATVWCEI